MAERTADNAGTGGSCDGEVDGIGGGDGKREMTRVGGKRGGWRDCL